MQKLIIISGMSGVGKDTVTKLLLAKNPSLEKVRTNTTRERRVESDGKLDNTYDYITEEEFKKRIDENYYLEWARVHQEYYGSPKMEVERIWKQGRVPILVIDVQGLESVKKIMPDQVISIFINYDPKTTLRNRLLKNRPGISEEEIISREKSAEKERGAIGSYDFVVINPEGSPELAVDEINQIIEKSLIA